jgi:ABC-type dipeptide/oligopeptide/nickel transport system permease component
MRTAILAFLHAATVLFPAVAIVLPKPSPHSWETDVPMALITMTNVVVAPLFLLLQFYAQYRECRRQSGHAGAFSLLSLSMQVFVMAILAIRLFIRLGTPPRVPRQNYGPYFALWVWDSTHGVCWRLIIQFVLLATYFYLAFIGQAAGAGRAES